MEFWLSLAVLLVVASLVGAVLTSGHVRWNEIGIYVFDPQILSGVEVTVGLTVLTFLLSALYGAVLASMRVSHSRMLRAFAGGYLWIFRGTPLLIQLVFWYNIALFVPRLGLPGYSVDTNTLVTPEVAAILGLWLNVSAYMCEVIRGGILSVDRGQTEAALAIGMTNRQAMLRIVFPQAVRVILPPAGNLGIDLLKTTSLVSVIGARDLMTNAQSIYAQNYYVIELLFVECIWYLGLVTLATIGQGWLERRFSHGYVPRRGSETPSGPGQPSGSVVATDLTGGGRP